MRHTTADKNRCAASTMPCATGPLLAVPFGFGHAHFAASPGAMRPETRIRHLAHKGLMHQTGIYLNFENLRRQIQLLDFLAVLIQNWHFHRL
jgi:hypothetical protein